MPTYVGPVVPPFRPGVVPSSPSRSLKRSTLWRPLALPLLVALFSGSVQAQTYGYTVTPITGAFTDIFLTGNRGPLLDNVLSAAIPFPSGFTFSYYGTARTAFRISTNGWIDFNIGTPSIIEGWANLSLPNPQLPNTTVAPFWDDLNVVAGSWTSYQLVAGATANDDRFIVQWRDVDRVGGTRDNLSFQVWLFRDGRIQYHYGVMTAEGTSFTVGLESDGGTLGTQVFYNPTVSPTLDNTGYEFVFGLLTTPVFALTNTATAFGTATACSATPGAEQTFTVANNGFGTLPVTSVASRAPAPGCTSSTAPRRRSR